MENAFDAFIAIDAGENEVGMDRMLSELEESEAKEMQRYLDAVNQDMARRKKVIAVVMLSGIAVALLVVVAAVLSEYIRM